MAKLEIDKMKTLIIKLLSYLLGNFIDLLWNNNNKTHIYTNIMKKNDLFVSLFEIISVCIVLKGVPIFANHNPFFWLRRSLIKNRNKINQ